MAQIKTHQKCMRRDPTEMANALIQNANALWRELALKSKPRPEFVIRELSKLKAISTELRAQFSTEKGQ